VSYTTPLEVDIDEERLSQHIAASITGRKGGKLVGDVQVDPEEILSEVVDGVSLVESTAPDAVALALEAKLD